MDYSQGGGEVQWNMAGFINMELADLDRRGNSAFISGEYIKALDCQKAKRMTAGFTFKPEERKDLDIMEDEFDPFLPYLSSIYSWNKEQKQKGIVAVIKFKKLYKKYVEKLNDALDSHGWYGARKKDVTRMGI